MTVLSVQWSIAMFAIAASWIVMASRRHLPGHPMCEGAEPLPARAPCHPLACCHMSSSAPDPAQSGPCSSQDWRRRSWTSNQ